MSDTLTPHKVKIRPRQYSWREWRKVVIRTSRRMDEDNLSLIAAGVGFYAFLAILPALAAVVAIWGYWADPEVVGEQLALLRPMLPVSAFDLLQAQVATMVSGATSTLQWTSVISIGIALWVSKAAVASLIRGLNVIYEKPHRKNVLRRNGVALLLTALLVTVAMVSIVFVVILPPIIGFFHLPFAVQFLIGAAKWLILLGVVAFALALVYRYGPNRRGGRLRWITPGAQAAVLMWAVGSLLLATYFRNVADLNRIYGSLGAVVGLLLWFWFSALVTLIGAQLNAELERLARPTPRPHPTHHKPTVALREVRKRTGRVRQPESPVAQPPT
ncbi:YihY/virulence factor BrkB family protein [Tropicimonas isoalkanivorans]|uniref:Membrane protein n=1 Tax=Tropicimonas isoalkanivorans TaxID=441112 RepID=A0A1I1PKE1_9RHOB|nr:YihY/virulence factor BrkB family protein [Tropicimonas isoalkanivorans]SFD10324.1 membrane protein [Tropicimonas isoalkanivorans]